MLFMIGGLVCTFHVFSYLCMIRSISEENSACKKGKGFFFSCKIKPPSKLVWSFHFLSHKSHPDLSPYLYIVHDYEYDIISSTIIEAKSTNPVNLRKYLYHLISSHLTKPLRNPYSIVLICYLQSKSETNQKLRERKEGSGKEDL